MIRLVQRQSLNYVVQAVFPTAIAALVAARTGRAQDVFLPGILYNGALALISLFTVAIRRPLVGFIIGAAVGDPTGWTKDRGLVRMTSKLTLVLAVPYVARVRHPVAALPRRPGRRGSPSRRSSSAGRCCSPPSPSSACMLSKGKTPMEDSGLQTLHDTSTAEPA